MLWGMMRRKAHIFPLPVIILANFYRWHKATCSASCRKKKKKHCTTPQFSNLKTRIIFELRLFFFKVEDTTPSSVFSGLFLAERWAARISELSEVAEKRESKLITLLNFSSPRLGDNSDLPRENSFVG